MMFEKRLAVTSATLVGESFDMLMMFMNKESAAYASIKALRKAAAVAEISLNLSMELSANALNAAKNPLNAILNGSAAIASELFIKNGLAIVRAVAGTAKVLGFQSGGRTSGSMPGNMVNLTRMTVAPNGKLLDEQGFAVAGLVHENEYVIPEWMRADLKVVQVGVLAGGEVPARVRPGRGHQRRW